jgi:hypothetical protein
MVYNCLRCGEKKEIRKGNTTGERAARYLNVETEINNSPILALKHKRTRLLCLACLEDLSIWVTTKKTRPRA